MENELTIVEKTKSKDEIRNKCMVLYTSTDMTLEEVAKQYDVPLPTIRNWSTKYKWRLFRASSSDQFEALLAMTTEKVSDYEFMLEQIRGLWHEAVDIKEKSMVIDMLLKVDKRVAEWLIMGSGNQ